LRRSSYFASLAHNFVAGFERFDAGAIVMEILQAASSFFLLWCTPSLVLVICLMLRTAKSSSSHASQLDRRIRAISPSGFIQV
jgi:hypothetical protein